MKSFSLPRVRSGQSYRVDRSHAAVDVGWVQYECRGTVKRKPAEDDPQVDYKTFDVRGEKINWEGHTSPDKLPKLAALHPTHRRVLEVLMHRAFSQKMVDVKITNQDIATIVGRSPRMVAYVLKDLTAWGFIGICHVRTSKTSTWRMIRVHNVGHLLRWVVFESPTWFKTDMRPDSQRVPGKQRQAYPIRVAVSGRVHPSWIIKKKTQAFDPLIGRSREIEPAMHPMFGPLWTAVREGYVSPGWYDEHEALLRDHSEGLQYAVQVVGRKRMQVDLNDPQLIQ